jgi:hypothetical protein
MLDLQGHLVLRIVGQLFPEGNHGPSFLLGLAHLALGDPSELVGVQLHNL